MNISPKEFLERIGQTCPWNSEIQFTRISQLELVKRILSKYKPKKLLDLGTGTGTIPFYLILNGVIEEVVGIDKDERAKNRFLEDAELLGLDNYAKFYLHDLNQSLSSSFYGQFDAIISFNTLYQYKPTSISESLNTESVKKEKPDNQPQAIEITLKKREKIYFYSGHGFPIKPDVILSQARDLIRDFGFIIIANKCFELQGNYKACKWPLMLYTELYCHEIKPVDGGVKNGLDYSIGFIVGRNHVNSEREKIYWQRIQEHANAYRQKRLTVREQLGMKV